MAKSIIPYQKGPPLSILPIIYNNYSPRMNTYRREDGELRHRIEQTETGERRGDYFRYPSFRLTMRMISSNTMTVLSKRFVSMGSLR